MCALWGLPVHNLCIKHNFCGMKLGYLVLHNLEYVSTWILCAILLNVNKVRGVIDKFENFQDYVNTVRGTYK